MDLSWGAKQRHRTAADTGGEPQGDPTARVWYKATEDVKMATG